MPTLTAQLQKSADNTLKISGALTFATVKKIWEQSQHLFNAEQKMVFDLQSVTQSDSAGVALLLAWTRAARTNKQDIIFLGLPAQMGAIAKVGGLAKILPVNE